MGKRGSERPPDLVHRRSGEGGGEEEEEEELTPKN
jgi:hypothetical protein